MRVPDALPVAPTGISDADLRLGFADPANRNHGDYSEQLTLRAAFHGGGSAYIRFLVTNLGGANGRAELKARVTLPDGKSLKSKVRRAWGEWTLAEDCLGARLGESEVEARAGKTTVTVVGDGFAASLVFETDRPPLRPEGGSARGAGGLHFVTTLLGVGARVRLGVHRESDPSDGAPLTLEGIGYVEHRGGNIPPYHLTTSTMNARSLGPDGAFVASVFRRSHEGGAAASGWFAWAGSHGSWVYEPSVTVTTGDVWQDEETGYHIPRELTLAAPDGTTAEIRAKRLVQRKDDLASLGALERFVVARLMQPWTYEYQSAYGIFEAADPHEPVHQGSARYVYQQLRP